MSDNDSGSSDVQEILENLQEEIRRHRLALGELGALEKPDPLAQVRQHQWVNSHLPIGWPVMPKGISPKLVAYAQKIARRLLRWYINPLVDQQNAYNAAVAELLPRFEARGDEHAQHLRDLEDRVQRLEALSELPQRLQRLETELGQLRPALEAQGTQLSQAFAEQVSRLQEALEAERSQLAREREVTRLRLQRLENWRRKARPTDSVPAMRITSMPLPTFDYFLLGLRYRSEEQMRDRVSDYDDVFVDLQRTQQQGASPRKPVLDIGCGRGEFVAHLRELGLEAYGTEVDEDAIQIARDKGLDVRHAEAFGHLESLSDNSLAAIVLIQVIEHFEVDDLLRLFELAVEKLLPGGIIVAETINPLCLAAFTNAYLLDPSHRTPLPPLMTRFLMEQVGFWQMETRYLRPVPESVQLQMLPLSDEHWVRPLNRNIEKLNHFLYGPQDYAVIAYAPED